MTDINQTEQALEESLPSIDTDVINIDLFEKYDFLIDNNAFNKNLNRLFVDC